MIDIAKKSIDLSSLPVKKDSYIDWNNSIGLKIPFVYDNVVDSLTIIDYHYPNITLQFNENYLTTKASNLYGHNKQWGLAKLVNGKDAYIFWNYNIGDILKNQNFGIVKITGRYIEEKQKFKNGKPYINRKKYYTYKCLICGYEDSMCEDMLKFQNCGCSVCSGRTVLRGINDMWTTNPNLAKMLKNPEDGYINTTMSNVYVDWICPKCGCEVKHKSISNVNQYKLVCHQCSDNIKYPNKFISILLSYLGIEYFTEQTFDWSKNLEDDISKTKFYDFYLPTYNIILEAHGEQHYKQSNINRKGSLAIEQENDRRKRELAKSNGYLYFEIDCSVSNPDFILSNLIKSGFFNVVNVDVKGININYLSEKAEKSFVIECYKLSEQGKSIDELMGIFHKSKTSIKNYISRGKKIFNKEDI